MSHKGLNYIEIGASFIREHEIKLFYWNTREALSTVWIVIMKNIKAW
jgi:hypothetical protein